MSKILIVDDDEAVITEICEKIEDSDIEFVTAISGVDAISKLYYEIPDLMLLDTVMTDLTGYEVARLIRLHEEIKDLRMIFMTRDPGLHKDYAKRFGSSCGYISKPLNYQELKSMIKSCLSEREIEITGRQNRYDLERIKDDDTGLYNEDYMKMRIKDEMKRAYTNKYPLSVFRMNIDYKGNPLADESVDIRRMIIKEYSEILKRNLRTIDIAGVFNCFHFMVILPRSSKSIAQILAQKLRNDLHGHTFPGEIASTELAFNIGVNSLDPEKKLSYDELTALVDNALKKASESGHDQIFVN